MAHPTGSATASAAIQLFTALAARGLVIGGIVMGDLVTGGLSAYADAPPPGENWRTSPFHGVRSAATGRNIPCVCIYRGKAYRLGEAVCMTTHVGTVVTRCDLSLNNTTWAPTTEPCNISQRPSAVPRFACAPSAPSTRQPG